MLSVNETKPDTAKLPTEMILALDRTKIKM